MLTGHCLCQKIQFQITLPTLSASHCHCESCRRAHSAAFVTWSSFHKTQLRFVSGESELQRYASSKGVQRSFCRHCGSPLFYEATDENGVMYVPTAALSGDPDKNPERHVSFEEKVSWLSISDELPRFKGKLEPIA